ncbi:MAG: phosphoadenosine phosphosulfate reductase family protein [Candidatus Bruticola sp.]
MKEDYYVLMFSGGKDSTAMVLEWLERRKREPDKYPLDEVVFFNMELEFPSVIDTVRKVEKIVKSFYIKFTELKLEKNWYYS